MNNLEHTMSLTDMDKKSHLHGNTSIADLEANGPFMIESAKGITIRDTNGKEYIDAVAGLWCMNLGYGRAEIAEVAKDSVNKLSFAHTFGNMSSEPTARLADKIVQLFNDTTPGEMSKVFFGHSGSDANDTNVKLMRLYNNLRGKPNKKKIIARAGAYHGLTVQSTALTGIPAYHKAWDAPLEQIVRVSAANYFHSHLGGETEEQFTERLVQELKDAIAKEGADNIAAFIAEPVMGTGGAVPPPAGYFEKVQQVLKDNDILLMVDEVITGFGRTGQMFASGTYQLKPDFVALAKGLTSAYVPLSASVISKRVWEVLKHTSAEYGPIMHGFTYGGHPLSTSIGLKTLEILERESLVENCAEVGAYMLQGLREATKDCPYVGDVRGAGTMFGIEYVADRDSRRFFAVNQAPHKLVAGECLKQGLICRALPYTHSNNMSPPLILTRQDADEICKRFKQALDSAMPQLEAMSKEVLSQVAEEA